jgi:hypothetical protein
MRRIVEVLRRRLSYANVTATLALFVALGGTSYAVLRVDGSNVVDETLRSRDVRNNSLLSRDVRNRSIQARDIRRDALGGGVVKESRLGTVPKAREAERLGNATAADLRVRCPAETVARAGVCIETSARAPDGFLGAINHCDQAGRGLVTMPQLDAFVRSAGPLPATEWTASVYRNSANEPTQADELEAVVLSAGAAVSYERVYLAVQHAFRCVALPSN